MEEFNKIIGFTLATASIILCIADYYSIIATPIRLVTLGIALLTCANTMMQVYHYESYQEYNPAKFWLIYCIPWGIILIFILYGIRAEIINERLSISILMGLCPSLFPTIGLFLGYCCKILFKR